MDERSLFASPFGQPGDILLVRETFSDRTAVGRGMMGEEQEADYYIYKADEDQIICPRNAFAGVKWTPSIHMPKAACRLKLKVKRVWVEKVQDIKHDDISSEGVDLLCYNVDSCSLPCDECNSWVPMDQWQKLWNSIYGTWDQNPWAWCCEFEVIK